MLDKSGPWRRCPSAHLCLSELRPWSCLDLQVHEPSVSINVYFTTFHPRERLRGRPNTQLIPRFPFAHFGIDV